MSRERKVLAVGSALVDVLMSVDDAFLSANIHGAKGGMEMVESQWQKDFIANSKLDYTLMSGGAAGNTIFGLAKLGLPVAMLSKIGRDENGDFYRSEFVALGGADDEFIATEAGDTGCCISLITPDCQRTMRSYLGASQLITAEEVAQVDFSKYEMVYIESYQLFISNIVESVCEKAKAAGCIVAIDLASFEVVNIFRERLNELITNYVDIVLANEDEAKALLDGELSEPLMATKLSEMCKVAVVKLGARGSIISSDGENFVVEPKLVDNAVDTTGAGDLWASGFLYGYLSGKSLAESGAMGSIVAAEVVQQIGASISDQAWNRIFSLIK